mgnify:CR=1 FL=1
MLPAPEVQGMTFASFHLRVHGFHCDLYGHVNHARYLEFLEAAQQLAARFGVRRVEQRGTQARRLARKYNLLYVSFIIFFCYFYVSITFNPTEVAENLKVKEVVVGDGQRRRRYAVCYNPQEDQRQKCHRERLIQELEAELASLSDQREGYNKRACTLRTSARYGRLLKETPKGLAVDRKAIKELERFDGKFVVHSNDDTLTAEDLALGYKQQQRVEEAWRTMKSGLKMRPVYHWAPHRIHAHIAITVLSLLLERVIEQANQDTWRNIRDDLKQIQLAQLLSPNGTVWQVTEPRPEASATVRAPRAARPPWREEQRRNK